MDDMTTSHFSTTSLVIVPWILAALAPIGCALVPSAGGTAHADALAAQRVWHAERLRALTAADGWLALVGLDFLPDGIATIGAGDACTLRYPGVRAALAGRFEVVAPRVTFTPAAGTSWTLDGAPLATSTVLVADDAGAPSVLRSGSVMITLVRRNGALALRVRDNESAARTGFRGVDLFPYDAGLVMEARVEAATAGERIAITNVTGFVEEQPVAARLTFRLGGLERTLVATAGAAGRLFVVFGDATNGRTTYGGGRFLDVPAPVDGRTTLDFNRAVNPPCSFTTFATCPTPPGGNRLEVPIEAGERAPVPVPIQEISTGR